MFVTNHLRPRCFLHSDDHFYCRVHPLHRVISICPVNSHPRILYLLQMPVSAIACLWSYLTPILIDPDSWEWQDESTSRWEVAVEVWQAFNTIWYGAQCASLHDPRSPFLALGPLTTTAGLTSMLVRECFVTMFEHVWATTRLSPEGLRGVIITGQPGVGVCTPSNLRSRDR